MNVATCQFDLTRYKVIPKVLRLGLGDVVEFKRCGLSA